MRLVSWNWFWYVLVGFLMGGGMGMSMLIENE
jgi:hypothetical protein